MSQLISVALVTIVNTGYKRCSIVRKIGPREKIVTFWYLCIAYCVSGVGLGKRPNSVLFLEYFLLVVVE